MERAIFISHASADAGRPAQLRQELQAALTNRGYATYLDDTKLAPGVLWRPKLFCWLGRCAGGITLLTPAALASPWVANELAILSWRAAMQPERFTLIPVLVGVTRNEVRQVVRLGATLEAQTIEADPAESPGALAARVVAALPEVMPGSDRLDRWVDLLADHLSRLGLAVLDEIGQQLEVATPNFGDSLTLAQEYVYALVNLRTIRSVEKVIKPALADVEHPVRLVELVEPIGLPAELAAQLLEIFQRPPGDRVLAVSASQFGTAARYVKWATCVDVNYLTLEPPTEVGEGGAAAIFDAILANLAEVTGARAAPGVNRQLDLLDGEGRHVQVLRLREDEDDDGQRLSVLTEVIARLRVEVPKLVVLVLAGPPFPPQLPVDERLVPSLTLRESEDDDLAAVRRMLSIANRRR